MVLKCATKRKIWLYSKANYKKLNDEIKNKDWQTLLSSKSIEEKWSTFKDEYEKLCDKHVQCTNKNCPCGGNNEASVVKL